LASNSTPFFQMVNVMAAIFRANFKKGRNTIKPRTLRKLTKAIHELQNKSVKIERRIV
jgi:hypothetical protein